MCIPNAATPTFEVGPRDCLQELVNVLASLRGGHSRYLTTLLAKVENVLQLSSPLAGTFPSPFLDHQSYRQQSSESERSRTSSPSDSEALVDFPY